MSESVLTLALPTPEDTDRLGARLSDAFGRNAELLREKGFALRLEGNLGAGKTSLVRAMLRAAGFAGPVKSPTFSLVETYPVWGVTLAHFDFYRFEDPIEFEDAGFRDDFAPGTLAVTEWSEKALTAGSSASGDTGAAASGQAVQASAPSSVVNTAAESRPSGEVIVCRLHPVSAGNSSNREIRDFIMVVVFFSGLHTGSCVRRGSGRTTRGRLSSR